MSKRTKALSFDEKRSRLMALFHETKDFFQLKDLEKMAPKLKGIVSQTVKEVLDSLVADNLVVCDKIGTSNYFWAFPSAALVARQKQIAQLQEEQDKLQQQLTDIESRIEAETAQRAALLSQLKAAEALKQQRLKELQVYKDNDPVMLKAKSQAAEVAKRAANRWTDHVFAIQSYCAQNFGIDADTFAQQFGLPADFDQLA